MRKLSLDPRTKLYMIFAVSFIVLINATTELEWIIRIAITIVPIVLLMCEGRFLSALAFTICYGAAIALFFFFLSEESTGVLAAIVLGYCGIVVQFMPSMIMAWYAIRTTRIGEFMSAMQKMHIPDGLSISLAVVMRFFPTIKEEYGYIKDAMKMRGISFAGGRILKMIEYRLIPLLFSIMNIGEELSQAAVTRGLGAKVKRTSPEPVRMHIFDIFMFLIFTAGVGFFIYAKWCR